MLVRVSLSLLVCLVVAGSGAVVVPRSVLDDFLLSQSEGGRLMQKRMSDWMTQGRLFRGLAAEEAKRANGYQRYSYFG